MILKHVKNIKLLLLNLNTQLFKNTKRKVIVSLSGMTLFLTTTQKNEALNDLDDKIASYAAEIDLDYRTVANNSAADLCLKRFYWFANRKCELLNQEANISRGQLNTANRVVDQAFISITEFLDSIS